MISPSTNVQSGKGDQRDVHITIQFVLDLISGMMDVGMMIPG